jgi:glutathione S-transferase
LHAQAALLRPGAGVHPWSARIVAVGVIDSQLAAQRARGSRYLVGGELSALDIYWATTCGFLDPMHEERCPMSTAYRQPPFYGSVNDEIDQALTAELRAHRDFIYETHLQLPIVF